MFDNEDLPQGEDPKEKGPSPNEIQKIMLIELLSEHKHLVTSKQSVEITNSKINNDWQNIIAKELNLVPNGAIKSGLEWRLVRQKRHHFINRDKIND